MSFEVKCPWCRAAIQMDGDEKICPKCGHRVTLARAVEMDPLPPPPSKEEARFPPERETLLLVIAAILVVISAGIMVVRLWSRPHRRHKTSEVAAIATLRIIQNAQEGYHQRWGFYAPLDMLRDANAIDVKFRQESTTCQHAPDPVTESFPGRRGVSAGDTYITTGQRSGYEFEFQISGDKWNACAFPTEPGITGTRSFYVDQTGVIRHVPCKRKNDPPADANSPPLGK